MIAVEIPGRGKLEIAHLLLDLNGTLATDGQVPAEVKEGAAGRAVLAADVIVTSAVDALDMLRYPKRLVATLRTA